MAIKSSNDYPDDGNEAPQRRTNASAQRSKSPKARRGRGRTKPPAVPGMQQRRNKHWSW
jgi:hypothetical protein